MNKQAPLSPPSSDKAGQQQAAASSDKQQTAGGPYVGRPLDGSQYLEVVEEQEYADRRPTEEEQQPRYSYRKDQPQQGMPDSSQGKH